ncbi:MAG: magnesium and cobalt transport protein CorA [Candidatus Nanopelagicaceae bacterium]|nr:magnesium and cobalt transport protein CorA [Candidatus Nanopelagicaceae bacterium]
MIVDSALYQKGARVEGPTDISDLVDIAKSSGGFVWLGLAEPSHEEFQLIVGELNFHPLAVEDAVHAKQRPKIEDYEGLTLFVLRTVFFDPNETEISTGELLCFISDHFIVIVRHGEGSPLASVRRDLEAKPELMALGPYAVLHAVLDRVIDEYIAIATALEQEVASLERKVFSGRRQTFSQDIYFLKREFIEFRHAIEPLVLPVQKVSGENFASVPEPLKPFFRDTLDHLMRACDHANGLDSLLTSVLQADLANVQVQQNIDVRKISAWVALAAGPTMIAGIYGMNFEHMPELSTRFGYPLVIGAMVSLTFFLFRRFKRAGWL